MHCLYAISNSHLQGEHKKRQYYCNIFTCETEVLEMKFPVSNAKHTWLNYTMQSLGCV